MKTSIFGRLEYFQCSFANGFVAEGRKPSGVSKHPKPDGSRRTATILFGRYRVALVVFALAFSLGFPQTASADELEKPNIVLFFVDDFGQRDLCCYGSSLYETPHMDRLAADGMRFTNAYSAYPRCVPSRQGLLSGKYPCRIAYTSEQAKGHQHHQ